MILFFKCVWLILRWNLGSSLILFFYFRLVVSSLEALESCFAVGSSSEKVKQINSLRENLKPFVLTLGMVVTAYFQNCLGKE